MAARWKRDALITNEKISPGNVIVGFASFGKATYEKEYNSGIGSNGLTSARHDILNKNYATNYPETFDETLPEDVTYIGKYNLQDEVEVKYRDDYFKTQIGKLILSPTRTFAPLVTAILEEQFNAVNGMIHCSGGGQTKCLKYVPENVRIVKDNLFNAPVIFSLIQKSSGSSDKEMYQVFNMGCRLEIYTNEASAESLLEIARRFDIDAQIIGRVEPSDKQELIIKAGDQMITY
jgi:phosphoribosylformylglycinamidine cyclo-ligase